MMEEEDVVGGDRRCWVWGEVHVHSFVVEVNGNAKQKRYLSDAKVMVYCQR